MAAALEAVTAAVDLAAEAEALREAALAAEAEALAEAELAAGGSLSLSNLASNLSNLKKQSNLARPR